MFDLDVSALTFAFAEMLCALNVIVWLGYTHQWLGAAFFAACMFVIWRLFKWGQA